MKTYSTKMSDVTHAWHVLDATGQPLGRLASQAATLLRGKHKPIYQPNLPVGDFVVIVNAEKVKVTGNKEEGKVYYRHSQYPGGLKVTKYRHVMEKFPTRVVEQAIKGMLPHNRLGRKLFTRLKVYAGPEHPHEAQVTGTPSVGPRVRRSAPKPAQETAVATAEPETTVERETAEAPQVETAAASETAPAPQVETPSTEESTTTKQAES